MKSNLIDMFGLSGNPSCDDQLDDLFSSLEASLEADRSPTLPVNPKEICFPAFIRGDLNSESNDVFFRQMKKAAKDLRYYEKAHEGAEGV
ncbi:hypothetical protein [Nitrosovibrio sp. Nv4]|uniref:hypothetical protein n=1 Tax=Nitrosovibrio sp. Nv4 TaxID=1945880 RepID=UPI000BDB354D|nr:hypothetical protein [Nitrosovibrio sp. Nv4]SOD39888.1 hypothetical protein SAMN06298226_0120 [Nitrosovibrio sp. Nv4]